ncbi:transposase domain-containing protein [Vagococcus acidifermentans]|uniref:transposase domain-containing protein n=1 Tax=Vagococcus acidifermentans TaxID=564710 RepID=UPI0011D13942|nr:transposase domain-containing protein [Vagococcus acidifermentans]
MALVVCSIQTGIFLSIIRMAKANQFDPGKYLTFLFEHISNLEVLTADTLDGSVAKFPIRVILR